jgi:hypothetical protein
MADPIQEALDEIHAVMLAYELDMGNQVEIYERGHPDWYKRLDRASELLRPLVAPTPTGSPNA